jgi:hypothetical protein
MHVREQAQWHCGRVVCQEPPETVSIGYADTRALVK